MPLHYSDTFRYFNVGERAYAWEIRGNKLVIIRPRITEVDHWYKWGVPGNPHSKGCVYYWVEGMTNEQSAGETVFKSYWDARRDAYRTRTSGVYGPPTYAYRPFNRTRYYRKSYGKYPRLKKNSIVKSIGRSGVGPEYDLVDL
jgi:hypothetical protein